MSEKGGTLTVAEIEAAALQLIHLPFLDMDEETFAAYGIVFKYLARRKWEIVRAERRPAIRIDDFAVAAKRALREESP